MTQQKHNLSTQSHPYRFSYNLPFLSLFSTIFREICIFMRNFRDQGVRNRRERCIFDWIACSMLHARIFGFLFIILNVVIVEAAESDEHPALSLSLAVVFFSILVTLLLIYATIKWPFVPNSCIILYVQIAGN